MARAGAGHRARLGRPAGSTAPAVSDRSERGLRADRRQLAGAVTSGVVSRRRSRGEGSPRPVGVATLLAAPRAAVSCSVALYRGTRRAAPGRRRTLGPAGGAPLHVQGARADHWSRRRGRLSSGPIPAANGRFVPRAWCAFSSGDAAHRNSRVRLPNGPEAFHGKHEHRAGLLCDRLRSH